MKKLMENLDPIVFLILCAIMLACVVNAEPSVPAIGGSILAWLQALLGHSAPAWITGILVFALELAGRLLKTQKPFSVLYFLRDLSVLLAKVLDGAASFLDKLLQNSSDPKNPPPQV